MRPSEYSTLSLKVALAASIALHLAAFIYASQLPVSAVETPLEEPFQVVFTMERSAPPAEPEASPAPSAAEPEPVAEAEPVPAPEPEPEPVVEPEPLPEPVEPEPLEEPEPTPVPEPKPVPEPAPEPQPAAPANAAPDVEVQKNRHVAENATAEEAPAREPMHLASAPSESTVHEAEQLPRELSAPPPRYPVAQLRRGVEDAVRVRLLIDEEGRVEDVEFLTGSLPFRKAIEAVVYRWRFEPATADGRPVKIWGTKTVQFALNSN